MIHPTEKSGEEEFSASKIEALRLGDVGVWESLYQRLQMPLRQVASRRLFRDIRTRVAPSDIVQDTFLLAHRSMRQFRGASFAEVVCWLHQILRNRLARVIRDQKFVQKRSFHREARVSDSRPRLQVIFDGATPSQLATDKEERELLDLAFQQLSQEDRQLITDHYIRGWSFSEIATRDGRSEIAVRKHWYRALTRWRRITQQLTGIDSLIDSRS